MENPNKWHEVQAETFPELLENLEKTCEKEPVRILIYRRMEE